MAKNITLLVALCFLFCLLPIRALYANDGDCVRLSAYSYVGVHEVGGNNKGFSDYYFRQLMVAQGWMPGYAWCSFFVMGVLDECGISNTITGWSPTAFNPKDIIFYKGKFQQSFEKNDVLVMTLQYKQRIGHTGIVITVNKNSVRTIEGNTNQAGQRDSRTGDAVLVKIRPLTKNLYITRWKKAE